MNDVALLTVNPLDYGRSFLIGKGRTNEVRFWIESRTRVIDEREGISEDFYQTASCKSENTFHKRDLFQRDNYDYLPIFSAKYGLIFRRPARLSARYRETRPYEEMFGGYDLHLVEGEKAFGNCRRTRPSARKRIASRRWSRRRKSATKKPGSGP